MAMREMVGASAGGWNAQRDERVGLMDARRREDDGWRSDVVAVGYRRCGAASISLTGSLRDRYVLVAGVVRSTRANTWLIM